MKNLIKNFKENKNKIKDKLIALSTSVGVTLMLGTSKVCAASGTESIDSFINFACDWLTKIGGVVALVGGVMFNDTYGRFYACSNSTIKKSIWAIKEEGFYNWMKL